MNVAMVRSEGGAAMAASQGVAPMYDMPYMPTRPSHHSCAAHHSTVS